MTRIRTDKNLDEKCAECGVLLIAGWDGIEWTAAGPVCPRHIEERGNTPKGND